MLTIFQSHAVCVGGLFSGSRAVVRQPAAPCPSMEVEATFDGESDATFDRTIQVGWYYSPPVQQSLGWYSFKRVIGDSFGMCVLSLLPNPNPTPKSTRSSRRSAAARSRRSPRRWPSPGAESLVASGASGWGLGPPKKVSIGDL